MERRAESVATPDLDDPRLEIPVRQCGRQWVSYYWNYLKRSGEPDPLPKLMEASHKRYMLPTEELRDLEAVERAFLYPYIDNK